MAISKLRSHLWFWSILVGIFTLVFANRERLQEYASRFQEPACLPAHYTPRIVSYSPLIIHLENFVTEKERQHLMSLGASDLKQSLVFDREEKKSKLSSGRTSSSAFLPSDDPVVSCVHQRAASFQGHVPAHLLETLQVVRYTQGQEYDLHYDWGVANNHSAWASDRISTFFAILKGDCEHCGTHFPLLKIDWSREDPEWCRLVECAEDAVEFGTVFRAVEGSAIFWQNLDSHGVGDKRVLHAGLPLQSGEKVGLNIWTRAS